MTLGQRIQALRKQHGLSQEALGEKLGVSRQAISRWEMDGAVPEVDKLIAMSKLFHVSLDQLLGVEPSPPEDPKDITCSDKRHRRLRWSKKICILLAAALTISLLYHVHYLSQIDSLSQMVYQITGGPVGTRYIFKTMECTVSDIATGFPLARGSEDLVISFALELAKPWRGWTTSNLVLHIHGYDPWGEYPDGSEVPKDRRSWDDTQTLPMDKSWFGPATASFTVPKYGGEEIFVDAILTNHKTGQIINVESLFHIFPGDISRKENFTVHQIIVEDSYNSIVEFPPSVATAFLT